MNKSSLNSINADGRYIVRLPFNSKINELGKSKQAAVRQLFALEARMRNSQSLKEHYIDLGHMTKINKTSSAWFVCRYIFYVKCEEDTNCENHEAYTVYQA